LKEVEGKDKLGFATILRVKGESRLNELEEQVIAINLRPNVVGLGYAKLKKEIYQDYADEEDADMGYSLFD